jgi:hypothetical protein
MTIMTMILTMTRYLNDQKIRYLSSIDGVAKLALGIRLAEFGQKSRFRLADNYQPDEI